MDGQALFFYIFCSIIGVVILLWIGNFIYGWYAEIEKRNRYMETQIRLTAWLCIKQGVSCSTVADLIGASKIPTGYIDNSPEFQRAKEWALKSLEMVTEEEAVITAG